MRLTTIRPLSKGAAVALAAAALAFSPVAAHADVTPAATTTTSPAPVTTTTVPALATTTATTSASDPTSFSATTSPSESSTTSTSDPTTSTTTTSPATSSSTSAAPQTSSASSSRGPGWTDSGRSLRAGARAKAKVASQDESLSNHAWFLQNQLAISGHHLTTTFDGTVYPDAGLTADAVLALDAAGAGQAEAARATTWLQDNVVSYVGDGDKEAYAGPTAKLLNVAGAQGVDPTDFGGADLASTLIGLEQASGQFKDRSSFGDFSNTITQSLAITGLVGAGLQPSGDDKAVDFLIAQQCPDGGFRISFGASPCASDNDATSYAVQALVAAEFLADSKAEVKPAASVGVIDDALAAAVAYLDKQVGSDGGVKGGSGAPTENANSTGLVAQALAAAGEDPATSIAWLAAHSYDCDQPTALRGGFAYDDATLAATTTAGSKAVVTDPDVRASTQALVGIAGVPLVLISSDGATSTADALSCTTTSTTSSTSGAGASGSTTPPTATSTDPGSLAFTGSEVWPLALIALALILVGALALVGTRRRGGAHA